MQCNKCGTFLEEDMLFCPKCGTFAEVDLNIHQAQTSEAVAEEPASVAIPLEELPETKPRKLPVIIWSGIAVLLAVAAVIAVIVLRPQTFTSALDTYIEVFYEGDVSKIDRLAPEAYWESLERDGFSSEVDKLRLKARAFSSVYTTQFTHGEDVTVTYEIKRQEPIKEDRFHEIKEALEQTYGIAPDSVEQGYIIDYCLHFSSSAGESDGLQTKIHVLRIDKKWYLVQTSGREIRFEVDIPRKGSDMEDSFCVLTG